MDESEHILSCSDSYLKLEEVQGILESSHMWVLPYCKCLRICIISPIFQSSATCDALVSRDNCLVLVSFHAIMCLAMRLCFFTDSCTLLDAFGGSLLGRQCPTIKAVGPSDGVFFGGERFDIQVLSHPWL